MLCMSHIPSLERHKTRKKKKRKKKKNKKNTKKQTKKKKKQTKKKKKKKKAGSIRTKVLMQHRINKAVCRVCHTFHLRNQTPREENRKRMTRAAVCVCHHTFPLSDKILKYDNPSVVLMQHRFSQ